MQRREVCASSCRCTLGVSICLAQVQAEVRTRILRAFAGRGLIERFEARERLAYRHSGFYVEAGVRTAARDRAALELPGNTDGGGVAAQIVQAPAPEPPRRFPAHYLWAVLIARIYEVFPLVCPCVAATCASLRSSPRGCRSGGS